MDATGSFTSSFEVIENIHNYLNASQGNVELQFPVSSTEQPEFMLVSEYWESYPVDLLEDLEAYHWIFAQDEVDMAYRINHAQGLFLSFETDIESSDGDSLDGHYFESLGEAEWDDFLAIITLADGFWASDSEDVDFEILDFEELEFEEENPVSLRQWVPSFVASLERVSTLNVPADKMMCAICWVDFGETNEFHEMYEPPELPSDPKEAENMLAFRGLPFDLSRPNNDAVRLPCGHLFGLDCIADNLTTSSLCPICRAELRLE